MTCSVDLGSRVYDGVLAAAEEWYDGGTVVVLVRLNRGGGELGRRFMSVKSPWMGGRITASTKQE